MAPPLIAADSATSSGFAYSAFEEDEDATSEWGYYEEEEYGHGPNGLIGAQWEEEKERLFGQLKGETTWTKTSKEVMREKVMEKRISNTKKIFRKLQAESKKDEDEEPYKIKTKKRRRKKKGKKNDSNPKSLVKRSSTLAERSVKASSLPTDDDIISSLDSINKKADSGMGDLFSIKTGPIVIDDDRDDPDNWAISSTNRQKSMYSNFYDEKAKLDMAARRSVIAQEQLVNQLSKPSDFMLKKEGELRRFKSRNSIMLDYLNLRKSQIESEGAGEDNDQADPGVSHFLENLLNTTADGERGVYDVGSLPSVSTVGSKGGKSKKKKKKRNNPNASQGRRKFDYLRVSMNGGAPTDTTGVSVTTLQDLEVLAEETASNQLRWRRRVEDFSLKVFGDPDLERGGDYVRAKRRANGNRGRLKPIGQTCNAANKLKLDALRKARGGFAEHAVKGVKRKESVSDFHMRLRDVSFFGPYSVKEVLLVAEIFANIVLKGKVKEGASYKDMKEIEGSGEYGRTREAMESKCQLHMFFQEVRLDEERSDELSTR